MQQVIDVRQELFDLINLQTRFSNMREEKCARAKCSQSCVFLSSLGELSEVDFLPDVYLFQLPPLTRGRKR